MRLTWLGHSCFKLENNGYTVILDPYEDNYVPGYAPIREEANLVLCSHDHSDHNAVDTVKIVEGNENPFRITRIPAYHDDRQGALRGNNCIHILDDGTFRIAHFGDLGCALTMKQRNQLVNLDVALVPVGGFYTIDAKQAEAMVEQIHPNIVVPMHYRGKDFGFDVLGTVEDYTKLCHDVIVYDRSFLELNKDMPTQTAVLQPEAVFAR